MTSPSPQELRVVPASLRNVAAIWDQQSTAIGSIAPKAEGMRLDRLQAGVFQLIVGPYDEVVDQVAGRCAEGKQRMKEIADALRAAATAYTTTEQGITAATQQVH
jgi:hypothetical protein